MRVYLASLLTIIIIATGSLFALGSIQEPSGTAFSTEGARINPAWSWRQVLNDRGDQSNPRQKMNTGGEVNPSSMRLQQDDSGGARDVCEQARALRWLFIDFNDTATGDAGSECRS